MEFLQYLLPAGLTGLVSALLTYLTTRRKSEVEAGRVSVSERELYIQAIKDLTGDLRKEVETLKVELAARDGRIDKLETLLGRRDERVAQLENRVSHLERENEDLHQSNRRLRQEAADGETHAEPKAPQAKVSSPPRS